MSEKRIYDYPIYSQLSATPVIPPTGFWKIYPKAAGWYSLDSAGVETLLGTGGGGHIIADEGTPLASEPILNFVGAGVTVTAGVGETIVTIPGGGGGTLSSVLTAGNTTGANNISVDTNQAIVSGNGGGQLDLDFGGDPGVVVLSTDNGVQGEAYLQLSGGAPATLVELFWTDGAANIGGVVIDNADGAYMYMNGTTFTLALTGEATLEATGLSIASTLLAPAASAILDVTSTTKGALLPRMTTVQRNAVATPATGLIIYNTTTSLFNYYDGVSWIALASGVAQTLSATLALGNTTGANNISITSGQAIQYNEGLGGFLISAVTTGSSKYWTLPNLEGTLAIVGQSTMTITTIGVGNYSVLATDVYVGKTAITGGGDTVTLPSLASTVGQVFIIADQAGVVNSINSLIINGQVGELIDGVAVVEITAPYGSATFFNTGTMWKILN